MNVVSANSAALFSRSMECHLASSPELQELEDAYEKLFLLAGDPQEATNGRQTVQTLAVEFLTSCSHSIKFCPLVGHILHQMAMEGPRTWRPLEFSKVLQSVEKYAVNFWLNPWKEEYRTIKTYTGFFKYYVEPYLSDVMELFKILGYVHEKSTYSLVMKHPPSPDEVRHIAVEMLLLSLECEIYNQIYDSVADSGYHYGHVHASRCKTAGKSEDSAKWILMNCRKSTGSDLSNEEFMPSSHIYSEIPSRNVSTYTSNTPPPVRHSDPINDNTSRSTSLIGTERVGVRQTATEPSIPIFTTSPRSVTSPVMSPPHYFTPKYSPVCYTDPPFSNSDVPPPNTPAPSYSEVMDDRAATLAARSQSYVTASNRGSTLVTQKLTTSPEQHISQHTTRDTSTQININNDIPDRRVYSTTPRNTLGQEFLESVPITNPNLIYSSVMAKQPSTSPVVTTQPLASTIPRGHEKSIRVVQAVNKDAEVTQMTHRGFRVKPSHSFDADLTLQSSSQMDDSNTLPTYGFPDIKHTSSSLEDLLDSSKTKLIAEDFRVRNPTPITTMIDSHSMPIYAVPKKPPPPDPPKRKDGPPLLVRRVDREKKLVNQTNSAIATEIHPAPYSEKPSDDAGTWPLYEDIQVTPQKPQQIKPLVFSTFRPPD